VTTNLQLLQQVGEALYGPRWQSSLSHQLGVSDRTMRRWFAGEHPVPDGVRDDLRRLVKERAAEVYYLTKAFDALED
jgi:hypothetical protein